MNWLNKLERKFGRYAVPNLIVYLIGAYSVGFVLNMVAPNILGYLNSSLTTFCTDRSGDLSHGF